MGIVEIICGVVLLLVAVIIIVTVTAQESKSGLGTIAGESGSFFDKNRGKTKEAMLVRATSISGVALVVLTLAVLILDKVG